MASRLFPTSVIRNVSESGEYITLNSKIPSVVIRNGEKGSRLAITMAANRDHHTSPHELAGTVHLLKYP